MKQMTEVTAQVDEKTLLHFCWHMLLILNHGFHCSISQVYTMYFDNAHPSRLLLSLSPSYLSLLPTPNCCLSACFSFRFLNLFSAYERKHMIVFFLRDSLNNSSLFDTGKGKGDDYLRVDKIINFSFGKINIVVIKT